jgi:PAS domain S-box-containing protein
MTVTALPLILNVDDDTARRYAKSRILRSAGLEVVEADSGEAALRAVRERTPHLVLLDVKLPDIDGWEVCRRIKADPSTRGLPVLHISATYISDQDKMGSQESGADIFLSEPVEPMEMITVVRTLLRLRKTELGLAEGEARMRLATEGAGIATWDIDLRTGAAVWSNQLYAVLGYSPNRPAHWDMWKECIHPDDLTHVLADMDRARNEGAPFSREHRIRRRDNGEERWLAPHGRVHPDETGRANRFLGIVVDITSKKRMEMAREALLRLEHEARREAEEAARLKDEFLATLSHELRNPMSAILGWLHLLRSGRLSEEQRVKALDTIQRNADLQTQLINDLLDVSRIITGKMQLDPEPMLLDEVMAGAVESVRHAALSKKVDLSTELERVDPIYADPHRLQQVFANLLSNAVKFTPAGGRVKVRCARAGDYVAVTVSDTGEGIPPEVLPYLFQRFRQADGSTTRRHGGLGLGLAIVRHIVEAHGGQVSASSPGDGQGATFTVRLPMFAALENGAVAKTGAEHTDGARARLAGVRVLAVDDEPSALELMSQILIGEGAQVRGAANAPEALGLVQEWRPQVMVLDIGLPGEDGYELLTKLRGHPDSRARPAPAIAVTGYAGEKDRARALGAGFVAHIPKPYDPESVIDIVAKLAREAR